MDSKFTKGKWEVPENEYGYGMSVFTNNSQNPNPFRTICVSKVNDQEQSNANLKLIAAAPEMFEMLKLLSTNNSEIEQLLKKITE